MYRRVAQYVFSISACCIVGALLTSIMFDLEYFGITHIFKLQNWHDSPSPVRASKRTWSEQRRYSASIGSPEMRRMSSIDLKKSNITVENTSSTAAWQTKNGSAGASRISRVFNLMQSPHETGVDTKTKKFSEANESIKRILDNTVSATNNITEEGKVSDGRRAFPNPGILKSKTNASSTWAALSSILYQRKTIPGWHPEILGGKPSFKRETLETHQEVNSYRKFRPEQGSQAPVPTALRVTKANPSGRPTFKSVDLDTHQDVESHQKYKPEQGSLSSIPLQQSVPNTLQATKANVDVPFPHIESKFEEESLLHSKMPLICPSNRAESSAGKESWVTPRHRITGKECDKFPFKNINQPVVRDECDIRSQPGEGHADPRCYIESKFRFKVQRSIMSEEDHGATKSASKNISLTIMGELQRIEKHTTIASQVVASYARAGHLISVFLTLQTRRAKVPSEWHPERFETLPVFDDDQELQHARELAQTFIDAGAQQVLFHGYNLKYLPILMPSIPGGTGSNLRFRSSQTSYTLHCLTRTAVLHDMLRYEWAESTENFRSRHPEKTLSEIGGPDPGLFDVILLIRGDAYWAQAIPSLESLSLEKIHVKQCLSWKGVNDKFAILPRNFAVPWMNLLGAYYNDTLSEMGGYWNSEELSLKLALLHKMPIERHRDSFATMDYYYWMNTSIPQSLQYRGTRTPGPKHGCFPKLYYDASCFKSDIRTHFEAHLCREGCKKFRGKCIDGSDGKGGVPEKMPGYQKLKRKNG